MRNIKRIIAMLIASVMVLGMSISAFANENITISVASQTQADQNNTNEEYLAYKIFTATKINDGVGDTTTTPPAAQTPVEGVAYFLASTSPWSGIVSDTNIQKYLKFTPASDGTGWSVTWNTYDQTNNTNGKEYNEENAIALAKLLEAKATVTRNASGAVTSISVGGINLTVDTDYWSLTPGTAKSVPVGYYLITSSLGANLILATTDITITEKNEYPTVDKNITGTSDDISLDPTKKTDAQIGDVIDFEIKATIPDEATKKVVIHDKMSLGLSLKLSDTTFTVKNGNDVIPYQSGSTTNWTIHYSNNSDKIATTGTNSQDSVAVSSTLGDDSFVVEFTEAYINSLTSKNDAVLTVSYQAVLNDNAVLADLSNDNTVSLNYSNYSTPEVTTKVYALEFDLVKYHETKDGQTTTKTILPGATFKMYRDTQVGANGKLINNATPISFVRSTGDVYRVNDGITVGNTTVDVLTSANGVYNIEGLDVGDYYLQETVAPNGYNKLDSMIKVTVTESLNGTDVTGTNVSFGTGTGSSPVTYTMSDPATTGEASVNGTTYTTGGVGVLNQIGAVLPSTGGIGTTMFYIMGTILVIGAGVIMVSRRRMNLQ